MKINEILQKVEEIGYAYQMQDVQSQFDLTQAQELNPGQPYDGQSIWVVPALGFLFIFIKDSNVGASAYVVVDQHITNGQRRLHRLKNTGTVPGAVTILVKYLVKENGEKLWIDKTEDMTKDGFEWLEKLINAKGRGMTLTDQTGKFPDAVALRTEWERSEKTGESGPTSIFIESHQKKSPPLTEAQRLFPMWKHGLGEIDLD